MNTTRLKTIGLFALAFGVFVVGVMFTTGVLTAANPTGVHVTVYQTDLYTDKTATTPVTVFTDAAGRTVDIVGNPDVFGSGTDIAAGSYKRIKFTVKNEISFAGPNPCDTTAPATTQTFQIDSTQSPTAQVSLYFATSDDDGSSGWTANGTSTTPFLMQSAITVEGDMNTVVRLIFNTADTLQCIGGNVKLLPPTMSVLSYVVEPPSSDTACTFPADYWFVHYAIRSNTTDETGAVITDPTTTQIIQNGSVVSGWGTMTFSDVDDSGHGTWSVLSGGTYTTGMAEHRHKLASYCPDGVPGCFDNEEGYFNPAPYDPSSSTLVVGNYTRTGNRMILYFPDSGYIEGGMTSDCSTFVGVNVVTADNDLLYAVRKPSGLSPHLPTDVKYMMAMPQFEIKYSETGTPPYHSDSFYFGSDMTVLQMGATTNADDDKMFGWRSSFQLRPDMFGTAGGEWSSPGPREEADFGKGNMNAYVSVGSNGLLDIISMETGSLEAQFVALGTSGSGIQAGEAQEKDPTWGNHRIYAGLILNTAPSPVISDLVGTWFISTVEARIESGGDANSDGNVWEDNNERPEFGLSYGQISFDATGHACGGFAYKNAFRGTLEPPEPGCVTIELHNECYECITYDSGTQQCTGGFRTISTSPCSSSLGITMPVFYVISPDGSGGTEIGAKLALDATKKVIIIWSPIDAAGVPYSAPRNTSCTQGAADATSCGDAANHSQFGIGVKVE